MLKVFKVAFAIALILIIIYIVVSLYLVKFDSNSVIGQNLRKNIIKYPFLVDFINLNQPGDNQYLYIDSKYDTLPVKIFYSSGISMDEEIATWITNTVRDTVGKNVDVEIKQLYSVEEQADYNDQELNLIRRNISTNNSSNPVLNIIYLSSYAEKPSYIGLTLQRDTIFLFKQTMQNISAKPEIVKRLEQSTILHEWGHLLGLPHSQESGCVMSNYLETYENWPMNESMIPLTQCWDTSYALEKLKNDAK